MPCLLEKDGQIHFNLDSYPEIRVCGIQYTLFSILFDFLWIQDYGCYLIDKTIKCRMESMQFQRISFPMDSQSRKVIWSPMFLILWEG